MLASAAGVLLRRSYATASVDGFLGAVGNTPLVPFSSCSFQRCPTCSLDPPEAPLGEDWLHHPRKSRISESRRKRQRPCGVGCCSRRGRTRPASIVVHSQRPMLILYQSQTWRHRGRRNGWQHRYRTRPCLSRERISMCHLHARLTGKTHHFLLFTVISHSPPFSPESRKDRPPPHARRRGLSRPCRRVRQSGKLQSPSTRLYQRSPQRNLDGPV